MMIDSMSFSAPLMISGTAASESPAVSTAAAWAARNDAAIPISSASAAPFCATTYPAATSSASASTAQPSRISVTWAFVIFCQPSAIFSVDADLYAFANPATCREPS